MLNKYFEDKSPILHPEILSSLLFQVIYKDLPSNLSAIRNYVENRNASESSEICEHNTNSGKQIVSSGFQKDEYFNSTKEVSNCNAQCPSQRRPKVPGLQRDIEVLKSELKKFIAEHGQEGLMPMRKQLRLHGRVDIEKAITRMGGFRKVASISKELGISQWKIFLHADKSISKELGNRPFVYAE